MFFFQTVCASLLPGSGPRSRRKITAGRPSAAIAPISELRISGRRPMPDSVTPVLNASRASSRSSSEDTEGWRISMISWSPISLRAHWMAPMPMNSRARPRKPPIATLEAPMPPIVSGLSPTSNTK